MELAIFLKENRETVLSRWFQSAIETYPRGTSEFLSRQKDQFRNPVGHAITQSIGAIYDQLLSGMDRQRLLAALDGAIRIRSVQELSPSQALGFIFELKTVIRDLTEGQVGVGEQLRDLDAKIDQVALLGFEKYTECREKLHQLGKPRLTTRTLNVAENPRAKVSSSDHNRGIIDGEG